MLLICLEFAPRLPLLMSYKMENVFGQTRSRIGIRLVWFGLACLIGAFGLAGTPAFWQSDSAKAAYKNTNPDVAYVGDETCKTCHAEIFESFKKTGMGLSTSPPSLSDALAEFRKPFTFQNEKLGRSFTSFVKKGKFFHQEIETKPGGTVYSDTREVAYAVGSGSQGRSYIVASGDYLFMSPLSFYTRPGKWDLTPGYEEGLFEGFSRPVTDLCVYCHTGLPQPVSGTLNRFKWPPFRFLAIGCERCHGPGALHVQQRAHMTQRL